MKYAWVLVAGTIVLLSVGYVIHRKMPPYELGFHAGVVNAATLPAGVAHVGDCPVFPADNIWNTRIDKLPKDPRTDAYVDSIGALKAVHPDFSANPVYGMPYTEVPQGTKGTEPTFENKDESDPGVYPIPGGAPIEGGPGEQNGDRHVIVVDQRNCVLYEMWLARLKPDGTWIAGSGMRMDLTSNALRPAGWTSADAAGLPIFPGLVRYDEVAAGEIPHALRFTLSSTRKGYLWPARHESSSSTDMNRMAMGTRVRLRADFDTSKYSKTNQVIMTALKRYGMFLADNGSSMYLSGVPDKRWDDNDLRKLGAMKAEDFEAVDESGLQLLPDSARVNQAALTQ